MKIDMNVADTQVQVGLDRIVIGLPYPRLPKHGAQTLPSQHQLAEFEAQKKAFVSNMKHIANMVALGPHFVSKTNKDLKRYIVKSAEDGATLCIFHLGFRYGTGVINFEVNPSKLSPDNWDELLILLSLMFDGHYAELYYKGVVSHAEFYVDVLGKKPSDHVFIDTGRRTTTLFKETTYHGGRKSPLVGTMYDKAEELGVDGQLLRFEARINRRRDIPFRDQVENPPFNPLSTFLVLEVNQLQFAANELKNPKLANQIKEFGLYEAVKNKHARNAILTQLKNKAVPWWQPDLFWAAHRELLLKFKPGQAGGFTSKTPSPLLEVATL